jgi:hypothetical protein
MMTGFRAPALTFVWIAAFQFVALGQIRPPNGDFETGTPGMAPPGWFFTSSSPGFEGVLVDHGCIQGHQCVMISSADRPVPHSIGNVFISLPAAPYAMQHIRVRAAVRVEGTNARARMLLRVGRRGGGISFFDDMFDRPIVSSEWNYYTIDATVLDDSESILFGVFLATPGKAWFDDVTIEVLDMVGIRNFENSTNPASQTRNPKSRIGPGPAIIPKPGSPI